MTTEAQRLNLVKKLNPGSEVPINPLNQFAQLTI